MSTHDRVIGIIIDQLGVKKEEVRTEARLEEDLGADSLDRVELAMFLEEEFGIEIPDEDADKVKTVNDIINYVDEKLKEGK